jgi:hypothetical protein
MWMPAASAGINRGDTDFNDIGRPVEEPTDTSM